MHARPLKLALSQIHASICSPGRKHTTSAEPGRQANHAVDERAESAQMQVSHDRLDEPYREQRTAITGKQRLAVPGDDSGLKDRSRPESSCRCLWKPTTLELLGQGMHDLDSTKEQIQTTELLRRFGPKAAAATGCLHPAARSTCPQRSSSCETRLITL